MAGESAVTLHEVACDSFEITALKALGEARNIILDLGAQVRISGGRAASRDHLDHAIANSGRHGDVLEAHLPGNLGGLELMVGIQVGVGEAYGKGFDAVGTNGSQLLANFGLVERLEDAEKVSGDTASQGPGRILTTKPVVVREFLEENSLRDLADAVIQ